jgi:pimeloyl-ACP methyl ester carboxylesterase
MAHSTRYLDAANQIIAVNNARLAYRALGPRGAVPLVIFPDAGHGGIFQCHAQFVPQTLAFLAH